MINISLAEELFDQLLPHREAIVRNRIPSRIATKDFTIWGKAAESEAAIRLGWVTSAIDSQPLVEEILTLRDELRAKGIDRIVLCGMGGSSLAPEVITKAYGVALEVLDSTNPEQVRETVYRDLFRTAVVVSSKSGSTVETDSQKRIFEEAFAAAGIDKTERIIIVTDPGSAMELEAKSDGLRVFNADATVGGRYSALTAFGLVPSGLAGVGIQALLDQARASMDYLCLDEHDNEAVILGAAMARAAYAGGFKDKIGIISDNQSLPDFADWAEQLIAESTGKQAHGILPVVLNEQSFEVSKTPEDMLLVAVSASEAFSTKAGILVSGELGEQFLLWEYATAIASELIGINPFDQPDVESAKIAARGMLQSKVESTAILFTEQNIGVNSFELDLSETMSIEGALKALFAKAKHDSYISVQAYLNRNELDLNPLREVIAKSTHRPVTLGWGPRFLHSTGQYHKGGPRTGVYLQLMTKSDQDLAVPGRDFSFGELISAQAAGDAKVLAELGRPVLTLTLSDPVSDVSTLLKMLGGE